MGNQWSPKREVIIPIGPSIAYVELTQGDYSLIDSEDAELVSGVNWHVVIYSGKPYAIGSKNLALHRVISNTPKDLETDHRNGDGLDNRKCNLRPVTHALNSINRKLNRDTITGIKGVTIYRNRGKRITYRSYIKRDNKTYCLGTFDTAEKAGEVYRLASIELHGEYRRQDQWI